MMVYTRFKPLEYDCKMDGSIIRVDGLSPDLQDCNFGRMIKGSRVGHW